MTDIKPPVVTGQRLQVLNLIRDLQPVFSFTLTIDHVIPEAHARITELKERGFNIITVIHKEIEFRGQTKRGVASYSLGTPEWQAPQQVVEDADDDSQ